VAGGWRAYLVIIALSAQGAVLTALVPPLLAAWGYPLATIGLLVAAQPVAALLSRLPGGLLYGPMRARALLLGALLASLAASLLHPVVASLPAFLAVRLLAGLAYGVATTVNLALFSERLEAGAARSRAMGYYTAGFAVGYSGGAVLAGYAADWIGLGPAFGVAAGLGALSLLGVPPPTSRNSVAAPAPPLAWRAALHPRVLAVLVVCFCLFAHFAFWNAYLPLYALAVGLTLGDVGLIRGIFGLCQIAARPASGAVVGRWGAGRLTLVGLLCQGAALLTVPLVSQLGPLLTLFLVMGTARALAVVANAVELVESSEEAGVPRGLMSGLFNTAQDLGQLAGPAAGGLVAAAAGLPAAFMLCATATTLAPVLVLALARGTRVLQRASPRP